MPHTLKGLRVDEISLVDAPANPGALAVLFKRKDQSMPTEAEIAAAAAKKSKDSSVLDRLLTRLGIGKRATRDTLDPDTYIDAASASVDKATAALATSISSIMADAALTDKGPAIEKSLAEFRAFTADATTEQVEKAMRDVALATSTVRKDDEMPTPEEQVAALTKQLEDANLELAKAKMSAKHSKFMDGLSGDAKGKFAAKSPDDREAQVNAASDNDADDKDTKKRGDVELSKALGEVADLQKRLATFEAERELSDFRKRATSIGVGEAQAEILLKASKGDNDAFGKVLEMVKAATTAARTGAIFKEFGGTGGTGGASSAKAEIEAKAETLMKAEPELSPILARVRVRKANAELAQRERDEERAASRGAA
jgi:hypothetical protein